MELCPQSPSASDSSSVLAPNPPTLGVFVAFIFVYRGCLSRCCSDGDFTGWGGWWGWGGGNSPVGVSFFLHSLVRPLMHMFPVRLSNFASLCACGATTPPGVTSRWRRGCLVSRELAFAVSTIFSFLGDLLFYMSFNRMRFRLLVARGRFPGDFLWLLFVYRCSYLATEKLPQLPHVSIETDVPYSEYSFPMRRPPSLAQTTGVSPLCTSPN